MSICNFRYFPSSFADQGLVLIDPVQNHYLFSSYQYSNKTHVTSKLVISNDQELIQSEPNYKSNCILSWVSIKRVLISRLGLWF